MQSTTYGNNVPNMQQLCEISSKNRRCFKLDVFKLDSRISTIPQLYHTWTASTSKIGFYGWFFTWFFRIGDGGRRETTYKFHVPVVSQPGWWFGGHFWHFPILIGNVIIPIDELIFFRGVAEPPAKMVLRVFFQVNEDSLYDLC